MNGKYLGYREITLTDQEMADFYQKPKYEELLEKEYLILKNEGGEVVDKFCQRRNFLCELEVPKIHNSFMGTVRALNIEQELAIDMLHDPESRIKLLLGRYGAGE